MAAARLVVASVGLALAIGALYIDDSYHSVNAPLFTFIGGVVAGSTVIQKNTNALDQIAGRIGVFIAVIGAWFWLTSSDSWDFLSYSSQVTIIVIALVFWIWMILNFCIALRSKLKSKN